MELYRQHKQHNDAMELLYKLSREPTSLTPLPDSAASSLAGIPGVWAALKYIHNIPTGSDPGGVLGGPRHSTSLLICSHAKRWLLAEDAEACIDVRILTSVVLVL